MEINARMVSGIAVVALLLSVTVGSGLAFAQGSGMPQVGADDTDSAITQSSVSLSEEEAIDIATAEADGTADTVKLESEDGTPVYEVTLVSSDSSVTEVTIHADDGTVLESGPEEANEDEADDDGEMKEANENEADDDGEMKEANENEADDDGEMKEANENEADDDGEMKEANEDEADDDGEMKEANENEADDDGEMKEANEDGETNTN
jgi:AAA ATPase containing von Willebrand factor type A (vWA) domain